MFDDTKPIYRQIEDHIKNDILAGEISADEQVMSTNQFASFYRINPATAQKAVQNLAEEGLLYKKRGMGMFVSEGAREQLVAQMRSTYFHDVLLPAITRAEAIGITQTELVDFINGHTREEGES